MLYSQKLDFVDELENLRNENVALKRAVESKGAAIGILRNELQDCQRERDDFRNMAENHPVISRPLPTLKTLLACPEKNSAILGGSENTLAELLSQSKEENKRLRLEISELRFRLHDAQSDLKILRGEKSRKADSHQCRLSITSSSQLAQQERETLIQQLEEFSFKCQIQESDLRGLLEERDELVKERDEIRHKWHRLNHVLNKILTPKHSSSSSDTENCEKIKLRRRRIIDLDAIITENRYLQQRLKQVQEEKVLVIANATKYKTALERGRTRLNTNSTNKLGLSDTLIMSPKQVSEFLKEHHIDGDGSKGGMPSSKDLKLLCVALLDSLNQKSRFIKTQKAANKMLIERVTNLERQLLIHNDDEKQLAPPTSTTVPSEIHLMSASLMEGYNPSVASNELNCDKVDQMLGQLQNKVKEEQEEEEEAKDEGINNEINCNGNFNEDIRNTSVDPIIEDNNSDSEEIVPLENIDKYISDLKEKRKREAVKFKRDKTEILDNKHSENVGKDKGAELHSETRNAEIGITYKKDHVQNDARRQISPLPKDKILKNAGNDIENISHSNTGKNPHDNFEDNQTPRDNYDVQSHISSSSSSFEIDISDYESDDGMVEQTLNNWQAECEKVRGSRQTLIAKLSPKRSTSSVSNILKSRRVELPGKLKGILK